MYESILKPLLFKLDAEKAHHLTLSLFKTGLLIPGIASLLRHSFTTLDRPVKAMGLQFKNAVGLAAGFDKDGKNFDLMAQLGFGYIEIGTVTPMAQDGNPKPRLFRLPQDKALINRMGFNNDGVDAMVRRLEGRSHSDFILGANIGKNKVTPNEKATDDYVICFNKLHKLVDYFVVNVSSPNTPGLRELQEKEPLTRLLSTLQNINQGHQRPRPLLLKIAPDLNEAQLNDIVSIVDSTQINGVVATNTTISRQGLKTPSNKIEDIGAGGLSGEPVKQKSTEVLKFLSQSLGQEKTLIGVGGIHDTYSAQQKIDAGANLIQLYSGLIYEGPWLVKRIVEGLK